MVMRLILLVMMMIPGVSIYAQLDSLSQDTNKVSSQFDFTIDTSGDKMPEFSGGPEKMYEFVFENIQYPVSAWERGVSGLVYVEFVVDTAGQMVDIKIKRSIGGGCDEEALRVINLIAATNSWTPGMHEGRPVRVTFTMPITFALEGRQKKRKIK